MNKFDLWPTTVYQFNIGVDQCNLLRAEIALNSALDVHPEEMINSDQFNNIKDLISTVGTVNIVDAWLRTAQPRVNNNFEIHCDSHKGTNYIGILWLSGDENQGGDLVIYDPAWRNPQRLQNENNQTCSYKKVFPFKVGTLTLFPAEVWHEVTLYSGIAERISLNFAIDIDGLNN